ncbi:MAG: hypothetical protein ACKO7N_04155, partial [Candidatus Nitrosotenuis sp.]
MPYYLALSLVLVIFLVFPISDNAFAESAKVIMTKGSSENQNCGTSRFTPSNVSINSGDYITWVNPDSVAHSASAADGSFDTGAVYPGTTRTQKITMEGTHNYSCMFHPWITGTISVGPAQNIIHDNKCNQICLEGQSFYSGDTLRVSGKLEKFLQDTPAIIRVLRDSNPVHVAATEISEDGTYDYSFIIDRPYFDHNGEYLVQVKNTVFDTVYETSFDYITDDFNSDKKSWIVENSPIENIKIPLKITNATIQNIRADPEILGLVISFDAESSGIITLEIPRQLVDAKNGAGGKGQDDAEYLVLLDGVQVSFEEFQSTSENRTLHIEFPQASKQIQIIGTVMSSQQQELEPAQAASEPEPSTVEEKSIAKSSLREIEAGTSKSEYALGEIATLSVKMLKPVASQNIAVTVTDPSGAVLISRTLMTDNTGSASAEFRISKGFKTGTYSIEATSSIEGSAIHTSSDFSVKSIPDQIQIVSVQTTDQSGNPAELSRGSMGFVKILANAQKSTPALVTVNIVDSNLVPLGVASIQTTLSEGESRVILSFIVPNDAVVGSAKIYASALSDTISASGIPLTGEFVASTQIN